MKTLTKLALALTVVVACKDKDPAPSFPDSSTLPDAEIDASPTCFDQAGTPTGCFLQTVCEPTDDAHFLNGCTDGQCVPYDNVARLPRFNNGTLPPLP